MNELNELLDKSRIPYFLCVGTRKSCYDKIGVLIGDKLSELKYNVIGRTGGQLDGKTIPYLYDSVIKSIDKQIYQTIVIDASAGCSTQPYTISTKPIRPGAAVGKDLQTFGEIAIHVNIGYFIPDFSIWDVLFETDKTDENTTQKMIDAILTLITSAMDTYSSKEEKQALKSVRYADLFINQNMTVRQIGKFTGVSKSCVDLYLNRHLPKYNMQLFTMIHYLALNRFATKYLNGGLSTKIKYAKIREQIVGVCN